MGIPQLLQNGTLSTLSSSLKYLYGPSKSSSLAWSLGGCDGPIWFLKFVASSFARLFAGKETCRRPWPCIYYRKWLMGIIFRHRWANPVKYTGGLLRSMLLFIFWRWVIISLGQIIHRLTRGVINWHVYLHFSSNWGNLPHLFVRLSLSLCFSSSCRCKSSYRGIWCPAYPYICINSYCMAVFYWSIFLMFASISSTSLARYVPRIRWC